MQKTRKLISLLLAVMMVLSMCTVGMVSAYALPADAVINDVEGDDASGIDGDIYGLMGDADDDGKINVKDATQIQKFAAKLITLDEKCEALADVNLDGKVNVKDATAIQKWVAKFDVEEPINCLVYIPTVETQPTTAVVEPTTVVVEPTTQASVDETEPTTVPVIILPTTEAKPTEAPTTEAKPTEAPTTEAKPTEAPTTEAKPTEAPTTEAEPTDAPEVEDVTVYFQNNWMWGDVSAHMWTANGDITTWPGTAMTFVENDGTYDIYSVVVPADAVGIIFNGTKDTDPTQRDQTPDILDWYNGQCFYMVWDSSLNEGAGGNSVDSFEYIVPTEPTTVVTEPATSATQDETDATDATEATTTAKDYEDSNVFLRGTLSDWSTGLALKKTADENVVELTMDLEAGTYEFKLVVDGTWYGNSSEFEDECENWGFRVKEKDNPDVDTNNCKIIATGGTYTFTVGLAEFGNNPAVLRLTVAKGTVEEPTTDATEATTEATTAETEATTVETDPVEDTTAETEATTVETDPVEDKITISLKPDSADRDWVLNDTDRVVTMIDLDTNTEYTFTLAEDGWYAEVPATVVNVKFHRVKSGTISHTWNAGNRGEDVNYIITGDSTGHWENEDMSKYADVYLPGEFNGWDQGAAFFKTDDANVVTKTLELAAGTYKFKVMEGSTWLGNGGTINDTTTTSSAGGWTMENGADDCTLVATGGTYTFNFNTSTDRLIILFNADVEDTTAKTEPASSETTEPASSEVTTAPITETTTTEATEPTTEETEPTTVTQPTEPTTESKPTEPETYTLYFVNSANWSEVAAYAWNEGGSAPFAWPGTKMTKTGEKANGFDIYSVTFEKEFTSIIFNNNKSEGADQTGNLTFTIGKYYDAKTAAWYDKASDVPVSTKIDANVFLPGINSWSTSANEFSFNAEGDTVCYLELNLEANKEYEFKVITMNGTTVEWRGLKNNGATITGSVSDITCSRSEGGNAKIKTAAAGKYIFAFDTVAYTLSITFPG